MKRRERKNNLWGLYIDSVWNEDPEEIKKFSFDFFKDKFVSSKQGGPNLCSNNFKRLSKEDADTLERPFSEEDVWDAVRSCGANKSSGPDGVTFTFVKKFWGIIKVDLMKALERFWDSKAISGGCNAAFLTLIPKNSNPVGLGEYRPISLVGVYYKILSKVLAERLKLVMGKIISETQTAFLKGRNILDGALIANETVDFLKKSRKKGLIFKVDFEKAYDSVEWEFLLKVMASMGFGSRWCDWIKACLISSSISILVNGSPTKEFLMEKGLRQGDPMAPFLFLIVAESLHILMVEAKLNGLFEGVKVGAEEVEVSHLQYADDAIFFGKWSILNLKNLMKILNCFHFLSGLKINVGKSKLFGIGVSEEELQSWASGLGCGVLPFLYLGLPVGAPMRKKESWKPIVDKLKNKLASWKSRLISFGGRLTLVKAVLGSLSLYYFRLFRAPRGVIHELERVRSGFFWGGVRGLMRGEVWHG